MLSVFVYINVLYLKLSQSGADDLGIVCTESFSLSRSQLHTTVSERRSFQAPSLTHTRSPLSISAYVPHLHYCHPSAFDVAERES